MPRPTEAPTWATNAAYAAPGKAWDGLVPRLEPPAGLIAEGWEPGQAPNARHFNWQQNLWARWLEYLRDERDDHETRIDALEGIVRPDLAASQGAYIEALGHTAPSWAAAASPARPAWEPGDGFMQSISATGVFSLQWGIAGGGPLPSQCVITGVRVFLQPGAARATSTDRMRVRAYRREASGLGLTLIGTDSRDNGTANLQVVDVGAFTPFTLSNGDSSVYGFTNLGLVIRVDCGSTADIDRAYLAEVRYTTSIL